MARMPKPWRRKGTGGRWYAQVNGVQVPIADVDASFEDAQIALARIIAGVPEDDDRLRVNHVVARFLEHAAGQVGRGELARDTLTHYATHLKRFSKACGHIAAESITPDHVLKWLDSKPTWGTSMRCGAITAVKRVFRWAHKTKRTANPLADMERPRPQRDMRIPDAETLRAAFDSVASPEFALFLRVVFETGCRRSEAIRVEAKDIEWQNGRWVRPGKSTRYTGKPRVVHITPGLLRALKDQAKLQPIGPLLRNTRGLPWTESAINTTVRRMRARLPKGTLSSFTIRSLRHLFVTDALLRGVPLAEVSELAGHANAKITTERYSHLLDHPEHLRSSLAKVRGRTLPAPLPRRKRRRPKHAKPSATPYAATETPSVTPAKRPTRKRR